VFGVILGTGTGGGLVVHGRLLDGPNRISGEWAHNPLPWMLDDERPGPDCYCGKQGCIETFLSGPGLAADYAVSGVSAADVAARAKTGEARAAACLARYEDRLARSLAGVINVVDPAVIVLGGGLSNIGDIYRGLPRLLPRYVFSDHVLTPIVPPRHGDSSGLRGAAWLWPLEEAARPRADRLSAE
jgi:fructokinase